MQNALEPAFSLKVKNPVGSSGIVLSPALAQVDCLRPTKADPPAFSCPESDAAEVQKNLQQQSSEAVAMLTSVSVASLQQPKPTMP